MSKHIDLEKDPLWRQIQIQIKRSVLEGSYEPGQKLPTEYAMAEKFGVNRHTIRRAVSGLVESGLLNVEQGRGMFVAENVLFYPIGKRTRFTETVEKQNRSRGRKILTVETVKADAKIAKALTMLRGRVVVHLQSITEVDERPMSISSNYFNKSAFSNMEELAKETKSITALLERCGVSDYFRKTTNVKTRMPSKEEARILKQPQNHPVLITESLDVNKDGKPISFGVTIWAGSRVQLAFNL